MADEAEKDDPGCKPPGKDSGEPIRTERKRQHPGSWINAARKQPVCGTPLCPNINDIEGEPRSIKKFVSILAAALLLMTMTAAFASAQKIGGEGTMYVYTKNGGPLNVRSDPRTGNNVIGQLEYGAAVYVTVFDGDWCGIKYNHVIGWVQSRSCPPWTPGVYSTALTACSCPLSPKPRTGSM